MRPRLRGRLLGTAALVGSIIIGGWTPTAHAADFSGGGAYFLSPIIPNAPADARSDQWLAGLGRPAPYLNGPQGQFAPPVYEANVATPVRLVHCRYCGLYTGLGDTKYADQILVPIPDGAIPDPSQDGHLAIIDRTRGEEWDLIRASRNGDGSWNAGGAGHFAVGADGHQDNLLGGGSATASHLPLSQAVSAAEVKGAIDNGSLLLNHALSFGAPNVDGRCWVYPALGSDGGTVGGLPEGARIQLDPTFDVGALATPAEKVFARTLQVYGAYLRDLSGAFVFYLRPQRAGDQSWADLGIDGDTLKSIPTDRFRVLSAGFSTFGTSQPFVQRPDRSCGPGATDVEPDHSAEGRTGTVVSAGGTVVVGQGVSTGKSVVIGASPAGATPDVDPDAASDVDGRVGGSGTGAARKVLVKKPKAPLKLRAKLQRTARKVQLVWNSAESGRRYRVYLDGRLRVTTGATFTTALPVKRGRHTAYVQAVSTGGALGGKTLAIRFTV